MAKQVLTESGWRDGAASPKLLPAELRALPGELVGSDTDDPNKAHELDAPHVRRVIVKDFVKEQTKAPEPETASSVTKKLWAPGPGERAPVRQWFVDVARMRVIKALVNTWAAQFARGGTPDLTPCHLWFPTDNVNEYVLRMGNPPSRKDRPKYLRDIDLVIDVMAPPASMMAEFAKRGVSFDPAKILEQTREESRLVRLT